MKIERECILHDLLNTYRKVFKTNAKMQKAVVKATCLQTQFQFLKNKKQFMIERKF